MNNHETHIPTQQTPPQKNVRFPRSYENGRRAEGDQPPPPPGAQKTGCLNRAMRLTSPREFQRVAKEGKRLVGKFLCIDYRQADKSKFGISASRRYGSAPQRNRFKRLVREAFRNNYPSLPPFELNIIPRQFAKKARFADIANELIALSNAFE